MNTDKSPDAFRTISEVADWLGTPAHVLRFWESRFPQIKPVKRAGGRRYYRPADMELLGGIRKLLHDDGMTIRGVQKLLREHGVRRVADLSPPLAADLADALARDRAQTVAPGPAAQAPVAAPRAPDPTTGWSPDTPVDTAPDDARDGLTDWPGPTGDPDAPMAEDLPPDASEPADVVPFVLSPRARAGSAPYSGTPDLFDRLDPGSVPDPDPAPTRAAVPPTGPADTVSPAPRLRMPPIPPDPTDADPLPASGPRRPAMPRRATARPDDRLAPLFHRLADLRGRMNRPDP
ncbi:MAG: MerR family transcriptional regulator [Rhodobacteraceae bacterium]|nr:MerR family transcriptional regulator [Paracoccaceae bacterium]